MIRWRTRNSTGHPTDSGASRASASDEFLEPQVRSLVSRHLGVGLEEIVSDVSLRDDLATDSLDLIELALALEATFAITVPDRLLDRVRT